MPHPSCVTFLYQSSGCNNNLKVDGHKNNDSSTVSATNDTITSTAEDDNFDAKLLSILQQKTNHSSMGWNGASSNAYESSKYRYCYCLERTLEFHTFHLGMIMDENSNRMKCDDDSTSMITGSSTLYLINRIDAIRLTLPLDSKRPTVNRRFYYDAEDIETGHTTIVQDIERLVYQTLIYASSCEETSVPNASSKRNNDDRVEWFVYCNRYLRILEYDISSSETKVGLSPHTDGIKICEQRKIKSTHTLLLYLSDCTTGDRKSVV